jgi:DNA-binding MarR family transcriptional regulator
MAAVSSHKWTFLSNHAHVLIYVLQTPDARIRDIADAVGITERFAHAVITDLVNAGYLTVERQGRRNVYSVNESLSFRHPLESHVQVRELLEIFSRPADLTQ